MRRREDGREHCCTERSRLISRHSPSHPIGLLSRTVGRATEGMSLLSPQKESPLSSRMSRPTVSNAYREKTGGHSRTAKSPNSVRSLSICVRFSNRRRPIRTNPPAPTSARSSGRASSLLPLSHRLLTRRTFDVDATSVNDLLDVLLEHLNNEEIDPLDRCTTNAIAQFMLERKDIILRLLEYTRKCRSVGDIS
jgi:hypothetical protein